MRCKQFNAELSTIGWLLLSLFPLAGAAPTWSSSDSADVIGALELDCPRCALYGPSVPSRFQTSYADGLAAILSGNAPKVKQYFIISCFPSSLLLRPRLLALSCTLVLYLRRESDRSFTLASRNSQLANEGSIGSCRFLVTLCSSCPRMRSKIMVSRIRNDIRSIVFQKQLIEDFACV
jgi:hypothetical protein